MSLNPYASGEMDRMKLTPRPKEEEGKIDHPLFEGQKMDMTR